MFNDDMTQDPAAMPADDTAMPAAHEDQAGDMGAAPMAAPVGEETPADETPVA